MEKYVFIYKSEDGEYMEFKSNVNIVPPNEMTYNCKKFKLIK